MANSFYSFTLVLILSIAAPTLQSSAPTLPKYISICKQNDPKLNECFLKSAKETLPHIIGGDAMLKIPNLDPLRIEELKIGKDGKSNVGLDLSFSKIDFLGLKETVLSKATFDIEKMRLDFEMMMPKMTVVGPYEVSGKVLVLPIKGKGHSNITLDNVKTTWSIEGKLVGKNPAAQRLQVMTAVVDIMPENMHISLDGLFGGDKTLGDQMNVFLNENWKEVFGDLKGGLNQAMAEIVKLIGNQVISSVPYNQLLPPK